MYMFYSVRRAIDWVAFRTTKRFNVLKIRDLEPNYWDKDTLLLHAVMQLVVDFVEIECAFMEHDGPYTWRQRLHLMLPWCLKNEEVFRSRELGLKHLDMLGQIYDRKVEAPSQAPKEIKEVYLWWKDVRPKRVDPDVASGFSDHFKNNPSSHLWPGNDTPAKTDKQLKKLIKQSIKIEQQYHKEDTDMLIKIIKNRAFMWT